MKQHHDVTLRLSRTIVIVLTGCMLFIMASTITADPQYPPNEYVIPLQDQWNLITVPVNASIAKDQIIIRNNSIDYNFTEAVNHGIIVGTLFGWDRENQTYFIANDLGFEPGKGYWLWAYYPCSLIIHSDVRGDGYITKLQSQWNMMGQTYDSSLALKNLRVLYNGTSYSWANATTANNEEGHPLLIVSLFKWDGANQWYDLSTGFTPGEGYWMYAYHNCSVRQVIDAPVIIDNSADTAGTGNSYVCNASVSDSDGVNGVWLEYWYAGSPHSFVEMNTTGVNSYYQKVLAIPSASLDSLHYIIAANDTKNHWNTTSEQIVVVTDDDAPVITNVLASPSSTSPGGFVNISVDVTDNIAVNTVRLHLTYPDLSIITISMNKKSHYYLNQSYTMGGTYEFFIWANDTSSNIKTSSVHTFTVTSSITHTITASAGSGGAITPSGAVVVNHGGYKNFTITPITGYRILDVIVDSVSVGAMPYYNFTNVITNHIISASFTTQSSNNPPVFGAPSPVNGSTGNWKSDDIAQPWITWNIPINDPEGNRFSCTIQCSNGQSTSGTNLFNGSVYLALSILIYSTTYKVWVNATDPTGSGLYTRGWYTFTTRSSGNNPPVFQRAPSPANGSTGNLLSLSWSIRINDLEGNNFTWTIQCSNGQVNSSTGAVKNGTMRLALSGLAYLTTYKVWVNATDPAGSGLYIRRWFTFTTKANGPPVFDTPSPTNGSAGNSLSFSWSIPINDTEGNSFNCVIQCSNGQSANANGASDGTKSLSLSGLTLSTTYKVWVNATDPTPVGSGLWTRRWFTFTTQASVSNNPPVFGVPSPVNGSTGNLLSLSWGIPINDPDGTVFSWTIQCSNGQVNSGTNTFNGIKSLSLSGLTYSKTYKVWVNATDPTGSNVYTRKWYTFTTEPFIPISIPTLKWSISSQVGVSEVGPLAADLTNDGQMEIIRSGGGGIAVYNGATGALVWMKSMTMWSNHTPMEIIDLNKDGILEIICSYQTGTMALHGNDGSVYWYNPNAPLADKYPVAGDINADGYPEVFVAMIGRVTALTHDGKIFASTYTYWPCWGGLSLGDTNHDGVFELYLNERNLGYDGNMVGKGVRAFWASNLTERWSHPEMLSSSHCPTLVDVNKDGILDVVSLNQRGGIAVFNSADGSVINKTDRIPGLSCHSQPTIYDIDGDGNLELIACKESRPVVWDLYSWKQDAILEIVCNEPPAIADIDSDGFVEILACNESNISIYNHNYQFKGSIPLGDTGSAGMAMIVAQDVDNDGLLELVLNRHDRLYVYDTVGAAPTPRALSQSNHYSQLRGRSPYFKEYGPLAPIIKDEKPANGASNQMLNPQLSVYAFDYQNNLMNIVFRTNASTGIWHTIKNVFNVHEGTYTANPTEMNAVGTPYWWNVTVTDSTGATRSKVFKLTTNTESSWWNTAWLYRKEININHTKVDANLKNFPVLINLSSNADLAAHTQPDGDDIVFTDAQGNKLNHEIELYSSSTGRLVTWVNVTSLSSTTDTKLYLYYGNALCSSQQNPQGTWNADYLMVHHMNETGNIIDSTSHAVNAVNYGTATESNGKIDGSRYFDSTADRYDFGAASSLNPGLSSWTISLWTKTSYVNGVNILQKYGSNAGFFLRMYDSVGGNNYFQVSDGLKNTYRFLDTNWSDDNWHYLTAVIDRNTNTLNVYLDGVLHNGGGLGDISSFGSITSTESFLLYGGTNGRHDEFTISTVVRNTSWIKTCYNSQNNPASFYQIYPEQPLPP